MDFVYRQDAAGGLTVDQPVVRYVTALAPRVGELVLFGRLDTESEPAPYPVPTDGTRLVPLPHYRSIADLRALIGALRASCRRFAESVESLDAVWLFGPHPLSICFARIAKRSGVPVVLGVRQDFPSYIRGRTARRNRIWAMPIAWVHEAAFRMLARKTPTTVVGADLAHKYKAARRPHVVAIDVSLVSAADIVSEETALARDWSAEELRIVSVGRLDPEKNPLLLAGIIGELHSRDPRWRLDVVGDGPLAEALAERVREDGLEGVLRMHGHVANGTELMRLYREAHAFLHVSFTEGLPQVLFEAAAAGLPIVATDVGGVGEALHGGRAGLLVPPDDRSAAVQAMERVRDEPDSRRALVAGALQVAREGTIEHSHQQVLELLSEHARSAPAPGPAALAF